MSIDTRIKDLPDEPIVVGSYRLPIDDDSFTDFKSATVDNLLLPEATIRETNDDLLAVSSGFNADYTYNPIDTSHYIKSSDFVAAGLSADHRSACELLDAAIYALNNKLFLEIYYNFSNTNLLYLNSTPLTIYAAVAGYFVNVHDVVGIHTFNSHKYLTDSNDIEFQINSVKVASLPYELVETGADSIFKGTVYEDVQLASNMAITATAASDFEGGHGTVRARLLIELLDTSMSGATPSNCCNIPVQGTFTNGDLVADKLTITHGLGTEAILGVAITDNSGNVVMYQFVLGDGLGADTNTKITIDFTGIAPLTGNWSYYFIAIIV